MKISKLVGWASLAALVIALPGAAQAQARVECVRVLYDADTDANDSSGRLYAAFLQNLLGHFPQFQQIVEPIANYRRGQVNDCRATIYIGWSGPEAVVPQDFINDYATGGAAGDARVVWVGKYANKLGAPALSSLFGVRYDGIADLDKKHLDAKGKPSFFQNVVYKGEVFPKSGDMEKGDGFFGGKEYSGDFPMPIMTRVDGTRGQVLAEIEHGFTRARLPYALRSGNRFIVGDLPFSYVHEADRYLVFADLLFDILGVEPVNGGHRYASMRIEDVQPCQPLPPLQAIGQVAREYGIPYSIAAIPIFVDPTGKSGFCDGNRSVKTGIPMATQPAFVQTMRSLVAGGARIIWHGVTHQSEGMKNPESGISGDDYEFWNIKDRKPMAQDSVSWVLDRMERGWRALTDAGFAPMIWEVPHYQASILDYRVFSALFSWQAGRITYYPHTVSGVQPFQPALWFEQSGAQGLSARRQALAGLSVQVNKGVAETTFFPYEIYGDYYGNRLIPEDMGYVTTLGHGDSAAHSKTGEESRTIDDLIAVARRNRVLRDSWASFFFHPYLLEDGQSAEPLRRLISAIQGFGYEFIDVEAFARSRESTRRPPAIERR